MRAIGALLQGGQFRTACERLEQVVANHPDYVEGLRLLAGTRLALGEAEAAEALLRHALELDPNWPPTLTTLGEMLLSDGRGSEAEPLLHRAATGPPTAVCYDRTSRVLVQVSQRVYDGYGAPPVYYYRFRDYPHHGWRERRHHRRWQHHRHDYGHRHWRHWRHWDAPRKP